jgi:DNA-binding NtrC family response regulator
MSKKINVLLVDDEEELVSYLTRRLSARGFEVSGNTSVAEALAAAAQRDFDVAVVDHRMPGMNGDEVTEQLLRQDPTLKVIILTGNASNSAAQELSGRGAFRYLAKPHDFDALVKVIKEASEVRRSQLGSKQSRSARWNA